MGGEVTARAVPAVPGAPRIPFGIARAQSWEDPALLDALAVSGEDDVLVVEASGDDGLALAAAGAGRVVIAVPDAAAGALVELKRAAAHQLPIQSVRSLLGLGHFGRRVWFYHYLRPSLPPAAAAVLDAREDAVREGLAGAGEVERAMAGFRARILPLVGGVPGGEAAWRPGLRWRAAAELWAPRLARLVEAPASGAAARLATLLAGPGSFFSDWLLTGAWRDPEGAHPWLSAAGLAALKPRTSAVSVTVQARAEALGAGGWSAVVLGRRPLDGAEMDALARSLRPGGRVVGWSADTPPVLPAPLVLDEPASRALRARDRGLFPGTPWLARRA